MAGVTVWYEPCRLGGDAAVRNVMSYSSACAAVYIMDNSALGNADLASRIPNAVYVPFHENRGVAAALNVGCGMAMRDGFSWVLTMDQDSLFEGDNLERYAALVDLHSADDSVAIFSLRHVNAQARMSAVSEWLRLKALSPLKRFVTGGRRAPDADPVPDMERKGLVMTSASVMRLDVWRELGGFDEVLFIDEVDHEYCIRVRERGYSILAFNTVSVRHPLGERRGVTLFRRVEYENDFRLYYLFRNNMIVRRKYGAVHGGKDYDLYLRRLFFDYCVCSLHPLRHLRIFLKSYRDYRTMCGGGSGCP